MKGYFGQLARHTGLRFADSRATRTRAVARAEPLHVEEVTMVSPPMPIAEVSTRDEPAPQATVAQKVETPQQPNAEQISVQEIATTEPIAHESVQSVAIEQPITLAADNTEIKQDHRESRVEQVEVERAPQTPQATEPVVKTVEEKIRREAPHEVSEVEITDPVEREVLVRQYLREVRAWVAASPMPDDESVSESQQSWTDPQPESVAFTVERESIPTAQPKTPDQIDVHDMNLSIGNISIVIEEPSPAAAAVIAPTPSAPPPQPQTRHEPTNLSRYYLRSW
jgi:hypothetical protein